MSDDTLAKVLAANLHGTFLVAREASRRLTRDGRLVFIGSSTSVFQPAGFSAYAATKAATLVLPRILAAELGGRGITVNTVVSGAVDAGFLDDRPDERKQQLAALSPFNRLGQAGNIADVVGFVCSNDARWVSGQLIVANGAASI